MRRKREKGNRVGCQKLVVNKTGAADGVVAWTVAAGAHQSGRPCDLCGVRARASARMSAPARRDPPGQRASRSLSE
ncbi:hypothetical protein EVAR_55115_1 [Eumeta japonica]|uniref:Uncharacterized protein n=1 Tax=Eumeta variegata TaxID=151549 RepID=A0A4C1YD01_EUMVA|nr:hypothetical protein EVAR_55115_1 [Eumeta japonica]